MRRPGLDGAWSTMTAEPDFCEVSVAKPNYSFEKRQRELAKKKKKEEKNQRRLAKSLAPDAATAEASSAAPAPAGADQSTGNT